MILTFVYTIIGFLLLEIRVSKAAEAGSGSNDKDENSGFGTTAAVLASVGIIGAGFMIVAICTFSWWRRQYRKLCPVEPPPDDVAFPPRGSSASNSFRLEPRGTMRPLDASSLNSDTRVSIEPFPSLETMIYDNNRAIFEAENEDDPNIHAHDWFENQTLAFSRNRLNFMQELGSGWFGLVIESEATDIKPTARRTKVIVQVLRDEASQCEQMRFLDQARIYRDSNHENIMKLLGHCIDTMPYLLIFEDYSKGDLKAHLLKHAEGPVLLDSSGANSRNKMALDVALGLDWMHSRGYTHPDLAARNCLVGQAGEVVIGDYGLGKVNYREDYYWGKRPGGIVSGFGRDVGLSIRWAAPESLTVTSNTINAVKATIEANVWSFGVVLWEICELAKFPYSELNDEQVLSRVIQDRNYTLKHPSIAQLPYVTLRDKMGKIMTSCFHGVPSKRPDISSIVDLLKVPQ